MSKARRAIRHRKRESIEVPGLSSEQKKRYGLIHDALRAVPRRGVRIGGRPETVSSSANG